MFRQMLCQLTYSLPFQDLFSYFLSTNSVGVSQLGTAEADLGELNAKLQVIRSLLFFLVPFLSILISELEGKKTLL